jgi:hypothetical protein
MTLTPREPAIASVANTARLRYAFWVVARAVKTYVFMLLLLGGAIEVCRGQSSGFISREYDIKAVYLYHFSNFIEWPARELATDAAAPFVIGVYESNPFGGALERVSQKKKVRGRPIEIRTVSTIPEALACQIVFIPKTVPLAKQNALLKATSDRPVLTVGETSDFIARGGNVEFFLEGNKVRFAFGAEAAKRSGLTVSPKLLTIAKIVTDE